METAKQMVTAIKPILLDDNFSWEEKEKFILAAMERYKANNDNFYVNHDPSNSEEPPFKVMRSGYIRIPTHEVCAYLTQKEADQAVLLFNSIIPH